MERRFPFGPWTPDLPPMKSSCLSVDAVLPVAGGWNGVGTLTQASTLALPAEPRGGISARASDGTNLFFAASQAPDNTTLLHRLREDGWIDVSKDPGGYTPTLSQRWEFQQFENAIFATNYADPLQAFNLATSSTFEDVTDAPRARVMATAENFLWLGDIFNSSLGAARDAVAWSAIGNPFFWPDPTTDDATAVLSGQQKLEGSAGPVTAIVSGSEVVAIFQENAIWRADFVGGDIVWQFNRMEGDHGCIVKGAAIDVERGVMFLADDGWRMFDYTHSRNIGKERVNDFFFNEFDPDFPDEVSMAKDPNATRIWISYQVKDASNQAYPRRMLVYDYMLDEWGYLGSTTFRPPMIEVGLTPLSLDSPDTVDDPDRIGGAADDTDPPGDESFDDRQEGTFSGEIGCFDGSYRLATFSGTTQEATIETGDLEIDPGRRAMLRNVRPHVDGAQAEVQVAGTNVRFDEMIFGGRSLQRQNGECNVRKNARFHRLRFRLLQGWEEATEFDCEFGRVGKR